MYREINVETIGKLGRRSPTVETMFMTTPTKTTVSIFPSDIAHGTTGGGGGGGGREREKER
jgi:hypothetical protein